MEAMVLSAASATTLLRHSCDVGDEHSIGSPEEQNTKLVSMIVQEIEHNECILYENNELSNVLDLTKSY